MEMKRVLRIVSVVLVLVTLILTACGGGETPTASNEDTTDAGSNIDNDSASETNDDDKTTVDDSGDDATPEKPAATPSSQERFHELLVVHPEAFDFEIAEASNMYVYRVPLMVSDTLDYLSTELQVLGWEGLGQPMLMGHMATFNLQQEGYRLNVSLQDNEHSQTTRVQMLLSEQ